MIYAGLIEACNRRRVTLTIANAKELPRGGPRMSHRRSSISQESTEEAESGTDISDSGSESENSEPVMSQAGSEVGSE